MAKPVDLGIKYFDTQKAAIAFFVPMLHSYRRGQRVKDEDAKFLRALIERHPGRDQKIGVGIDFFFKDAPPDDHGDLSQRCFWIQRTDGSQTDFSYRNCIKGEPPSMKILVMGAMRDCVREEITEARRVLFDDLKNEEEKIQCPATGKWISYWETHADHQAPMTSEVIAKACIDSHQLTWETFPLSKSRDCQSAATFTDPDLIPKFKDFHRRMSANHIVLTDKNRNLSEGDKHRLRTNKKVRQATLHLRAS